VDACAEDQIDPWIGDEALCRAEQLVTAAAERLRQQDDKLESAYGLIECLVELGPPMAIVEGSVVRAWSPALQRLTRVPRTTAVGKRVTQLLPTLVPSDLAPWRWTDPSGGAWGVTVRSGGPHLQLLLWTDRVGTAEGAPPPTDPLGVDEWDLRELTRPR
jgi:hypothetical protein